MMYFLTIVLGLTTLLLCYAGYIFLVVDKRQDKQILENPELYDELDDKEYHFVLPAEIDEYEETRASKPTDKCAAATPPTGRRALAGLAPGAGGSGRQASSMPPCMAESCCAARALVQTLAVPARGPAGSLPPSAPANPAPNPDAGGRCPWLC